MIQNNKQIVPKKIRPRLRQFFHRDKFHIMLTCRETFDDVAAINLGIKYYNNCNDWI